MTELLHDRRLLVVGDAMLDQYWFGDANRISPEAPVPVVRITRREERLGGAANVARNIAAMGAGVSLLTVLGDDESGKHLEALLHHSSIRPLLHFDPKLETTVKLRIVARQQQMLRADFESMPQEEVLRRMVVSDFQVPWNKLYRRKLLENLRYPENKAFEDTCLMPVIYARAASACGVWDFLYNYRIVTGSAMHRKTTLKTLDWVEAWYRLFDVLYQNGIRDALCAAYRPILTAVWDIWLHLTPEERKSPRMKEAFAYERTARHRLMQARGVTLKNLWAAVVCAASACSYLDLCRKRAERRQKTT